jgi:hypothetical protein
MPAKRLTFIFIAVLCAMPVALVVAQQSATPAPAQTPPLVDQTRKNIQVLKGLPESQIFPLMNFVATSLGVGCEYCHVKNPGKNPQTGGDNWVWQSDDKPKKLVGRQMMKMVLEINRTNFDRETSVTCYTCHRGSTVIARLPPLPPKEVARTAELTLPSAEQVLSKYFAAIGGKEAAAKFQTTVMKGTVEFDRDPKERNSQIEVKQKGSDKFLIVRTAPQGVSTLIVNGTVGWVKTGTGSREFSGRDLEVSRRAATAYYSATKVVDQPAQMRVLGAERVADREAYVLALAVDPDTTIKYFFDTQTGLLLRQVTTTRTLLAPVPEQVEFEDYRDVDGVKLPFTVRSSDTSTFSTATRRFTEIRHNVAVDDSLFAPPR